MTAGGGVFLAGDIGGTSTRLGLFEVMGGRLSLVAGERYASREHAGLAPIVRRFLDAHGRAVEHACFGVAGPVIGRRVETPNLAWDVDADAIAHELAVSRVDVINDLEANSHGIFTLAPEDCVVLNPGDAGARGNAGIISAGTGLGEAGMYWDGRHHHPFACEGGHADYAPHSDVEIDLLRHLRARFGAHVSWERVVSGPGLLNIYEFMRDTGRGSEPPWLREAMAAGDPSAVIAESALAGRSELCDRALDLFVSAYGAEAGNLALKVMATGGLYVGGGIAPKIIARITAGTFMEAFTAKGRLADLLAAISVRVIVNDRAALFGAARCAAVRDGLLAPASL
jgi:glucokinase